MIPAVPAGVTASITSGVVPLQLFSGEFLTFAVIFFVLAIIAAIFGARGVAGVSMSIAKWFVIIFIVLAIISLVL
jgi:uncharacterized membrane protein YtjA (UPF0391 family)